MEEEDVLAAAVEVLALAAVGGAVGTTVAGWLDREKERNERGAAEKAGCPGR